jgi:hypothetical protein
MGFDKPSDLAIIVGIIGMVIIVGLLGVQSINQTHTHNASAETDFFTSGQDALLGSTGLEGAGSDITDALGSESGDATTTSEESIVQAGFNSMLDLGKTFNALKAMLSDEQGSLQSEIGINPALVTMLLSMIIIVFGVVIYTWLRGS